MAEVTSSSLVGSTAKTCVSKRETRDTEKGRNLLLALCQLPDSYPAARQLSEGVPHRAGGLVAHRGQVVGVGVEGHGYGGVSEELLHDLGVDAAA
jgi:hypothetical protein